MEEMLIESETMRKKMGEESLKNFNAKFQLEKVNEQMLKFYENIILQQQ